MRILSNGSRNLTNVQKSVTNVQKSVTNVRKSLTNENQKIEKNDENCSYGVSKFITVRFMAYYLILNGFYLGEIGYSLRS